MKKYCILFFLIPFVGNTQLIDFNLFKPRVTIGSQYVFKNNADSLSIGLADHQASALIPIKSKFDVDFDLKNVFKSKNVVDALVKTVNPKFHQVFARVGAGYRNYTSSIFNNPVTAYNVSAGISGINLQLKSGRFRFFMYSLNARLQEQFDKYKSISPSFSGMFGVVKINSLSSAFFYGFYANYFGNRVIPAPVLGFYKKINPISSFLLVFPYQAKYSLTFPSISQDFGVSLNGFTNGVFNDSILPLNRDNRLNFLYSQLRISSQTRFALGKKSFFYLEAGWQTLNNYSFFEGNQIYAGSSLKGNAFVKASVSFVLGKSLFNSSIFDLDI